MEEDCIFDSVDLAMAVDCSDAEEVKALDDDDEVVFSVLWATLSETV